MNELTNTTGNSLSVLDGLAMQAKMFVSGMAMNLLQLGRVLTEARPLVNHGDWEGWVGENAGISLRKAEQYMQAYATFGERADIAALGTSKVLKLLPLPEAEREEFLTENDVSGMTVREMDEAIKAARAEERAKAQAEIDELRNRPPEVPESLRKSLQEKDDMITAQSIALEQAKQSGQDAIKEVHELRKKNIELEQENQDQAAMLEEAQEDYNRVQDELLAVRSTIAKGDAERMPTDQLTPDAFSEAVRQFIGKVARMPHMRSTFSMMPAHDKEIYQELLCTVESWANGARKALDTTAAEGVIV